MPDALISVAPEHQCCFMDSETEDQCPLAAEFAIYGDADPYDRSQVCRDHAGELLTSHAEGPVNESWQVYPMENDDA